MSDKITVIICAIVASLFFTIAFKYINERLNELSIENNNKAKIKIIKEKWENRIEEMRRYEFIN